jgi:hypothetical protein
MSDEKGIKFYLISTEDGPQLEHLQVEAKKRDPHFKTIYVDTTKQPLMERLNDLMRRANGGASAPTVEEGEVLEVAPLPPLTSSSPIKRPAKSERIYDQIGFEQFVWDLPDEEAHRLDILEAIIKERRDEINGVKRNSVTTATSYKPTWEKRT